ncbi:MAG: CCA tRNA nucleotidyltransferase [Kiloniellales bacterium]|nr:CCA tRNA nucleotidyltransferase [Kiloniellales bacterium]
MTPAQLPPQPWMSDPAARAVIAALEAEGTEVRFVGGCVRNALLGIPVADVDIATPDPPEAVVRLLEAAGLKAVPTGIDHGTVTAVADHKPFEVTTLRVDVETYGRHARVAFTDDWQADAARRDLTINALSCRPGGQLFDYFGGLDDLRAGRIRFVGDARARIEEDYLRLLRFFRFQALYGKVPADPAILDIAEALAPELRRLSGERVRDELLKTLRAGDPVPVLEIMIARKVLDAVLPEELGTAVLTALIAVEPATAEDEGPPDAIRRLAALLRPERSAALAVAERLRLSNVERDRLVLLAEGEDYLKVDAAVFDHGIDDGGRALRRLLYRLGPENLRDVVLLDYSRRRAAGKAPAPATLERALFEARAWQAPRFPLKGRDLLALGIPHGPEVGELLDRVEAWWIEEDFRPARAACLRKARALRGQSERS